MESSMSNLSILMNMGERLVVPPFQRGFEWEEEHWNEITSDVLRLSLNRAAKAHFTGSIVLRRWATDNDSFSHVVDGQQRLITLNLLIEAIRREAIRIGFDNSVLVNKARYLVSVEDSLRNPKYVRAPKLTLRTMDDRIAFVSCFEEEDPGKTGSFQRCLWYLGERLRAHLSERDEDPLAILNAVFEAATTRMTFSMLKFGDNDPDVYQVFQSINATGKSLSQADLVRSFVYEKLKSPEQMDSFANLYWDKFENSINSIRIDELADNRGKNETNLMYFYWSTLVQRRGVVVDDKMVYDGFRMVFSNETAVETHDTLVAFRKPWLSIMQIRGPIRSHYSEAVNDGFNGLCRDLLRIKIDYVVPFVLQVFKRVEDRRLSRTEATAVMKVVRDLLMRRIVCRRETKGHNPFLATLSHEEADLTTGGIETAIRTNLGDRMNSASPVPDDEEFFRSLTTNEIYRQSQTTAQMLLLGIEKALDRDTGSIVTDATVEHIWPQSPDPAWGTKIPAIDVGMLNQLGNLTLLAGRANSEARNAPFDVKLDVYRKSKYMLTRELVRYEQWTADSIRRRSHELAEHAIRIWNPLF